MMMARRSSAGPRREDAPRRDEGTVTEELDGEAVVYSDRTGNIHVMNPIATLIWQQLDGQVTLEQLSVDLSEVFGAPLDVVRTDVLQVVRTFHEDELLDDGRSHHLAPRPDDRGAEDDAGPAPSDAYFLPEPPPG